MNIKKAAHFTKIQKLAKLDNWKQTDGDRGAVKAWLEITGEDLGKWHGVPDYFRSFDAIIPLIAKQPQYIQTLVENIVLSNAMFKTTPSELCEYLLEATK